MQKVIIIHGWGGSPDGGFKPWLKKELEKLGHRVEAPIMPNTDNPDMNQWIDEIKKIVSSDYESSTLIGHSLGGLAILKFLEVIPDNKKINKVILVASVINEITNLDESEKLIAHPWLNAPLDIAKITGSTNEIVAYFSDNDPYIPLRSAAFVKEKLKGEVIIENNMGHYNEEGGIYEVPQILANIIDRASG